MSVTALPTYRTADPYRDLDVIDARAPRFNQAAVGLLSLVAVLTGAWPILTVLALQLAVGLRFGRRWCLACVAYFELVQPRVGEGPIEDSRPPRFADQVGLVVLTAASVAYAVGLAGVGAALGGLVAALALLAAATGLCAGCEIYRLAARLRGVRRHGFERVDLAELGVDVASLGRADDSGEVVVAFSHPLCSECRTLARELEASGRRHVVVDVRQRPDVARRYGVALVPTAVTVAPDGRVVARLTG
ncbi:MAG: DUF4395 family protein [Chloroflexota bacterium]|nr:DUF4395 family protein [Chloroflexota bacterium]